MTAKRKRRKPPSAAETSCASWGDVDVAVAEIGRLRGEALVREERLKKRIARLRAETGAATKECLETAKGLEADVEAFCEAHKADFGRDRSRKLAHGRVGWRRTTHVRLKNKVDSVVAALEARHLEAAVTVRKSANKDVLATYPDEVLAEVGAKRVTKDAFFVETKRETPEGGD